MEPLPQACCNSRKMLPVPGESLLIFGKRYAKRHLTGWMREGQWAAAEGGALLLAAGAKGVGCRSLICWLVSST